MLHRSRFGRPARRIATRDSNVNLDIGQMVHVPVWQPDGTSRVAYRGAQWQVRLAPGATQAAGEHTIVALRGSELLLAPLSPPAPPHHHTAHS